MLQEAAGRWSAEAGLTPVPVIEGWSWDILNTSLKGCFGVQRITILHGWFSYRVSIGSCRLLMSASCFLFAKY